MYVEIEVPHGRLIKDDWRFYIRSDARDNIEIMLDGYARYTRQSPRHRKWERQEFFARLSHRQIGTTQLREAPRVPSFVRDELERRLSEKTIYNFAQE